MTIKPGKYLSCGCCGTGFRTWPGYIDQDQDNGYGICAECQDLIADDNRRAMDDIIAVFASGLKKPENQASFAARSRREQEAIVWQAMDEGILVWQIGRAS